MSYLVPPITINTIKNEFSSASAARSSGFFSGNSLSNSVDFPGNIDFVGGYGFTIAAAITTDQSGRFRISEGGAVSAPAFLHSDGLTTVGTSSGGVQSLATRTLPPLSKVFAVAVYDTTSGISVYFNGSKVASTAHTSWGVVSGQTRFFRGNPLVSTIGHSLFIYNRSLSDSEVMMISLSNYLQYQDHGASGTAATSGVLVVGKKYRITAYQSGDDFANVGASSNANGVEFVASGANPTSWANGSSVVQLGLVVDLTPEGAGPSNWMNNNVAGPNATVSGSFLINRKALSADKHVLLSNLPTSASGLAAGRVWNDAGTLKIVT